METLDHSIFLDSLRYIQAQLDSTGLNALEQQVLERLIHSSGDFAIQSLLRFSKGSCEEGISALLAGAPILTDTEMAAAAVRPMACRTLNSSVFNTLEWAPKNVSSGVTRTAAGIERAWQELSLKFKDPQSPVVLIGSAPTALIALLDLLSKGAPNPSLIIGMPVGFIKVSESKIRLCESNLPYICLEGNRGGAGLAAASVNALLRAAKLQSI